jgi:integrase
MSHVQKRSGRGWVARYRTPDGKERSKSFRRKIDGDRFLAQIEVDKSRGDWVDPRLGRITLGEWTEEYLSTITNLRPSTRVRDESYIRNHVIPKFGTTPLSSIEHMAIRAWVAELAETKAPSTVHKAHQLLSKILRTAMDAGLLARNPAERVPLPRIERIEMQFLTPSQIWTLADAMDNRYRALVLTAAYTGLRIGELAALRNSKLDLNTRQLTVTETLVEVRGQLIFNPPKTSRGVRTVPIPRIVAKELSHHHKQYGSNEPDSFVFEAPEGGPVRVPNWRHRFWTPATTAAGFNKLRIHDLRHTAVALWIAVDANPVDIARRAGHSSVSVVLDRYGHLMPGTQDKVTDALDTLANESNHTTAAPQHAN